ncbi:UNVERIFIED_CONTAM: hypothetical protein HDU68_011186 [Siphonaria sp. JEL0065]|nr:hypothetical protein HDU68_011186 [Siphonaria sp. JEL0065]
MLTKDREERYQLSRARVKNWDNTILGQRRKKLEARNERFREEELLRIEMDRQNALEEADRRQKVIDRAKMMQYHNQDSVRAFHSKVLLYQVLKERDLQLKMKQINQNQNTRESKRIAFQECQEIANQQIKEDAYKQAQDKVKRLQYAREQMLQMKDKFYKEQVEKEALAQEQAELVKKDEEYRQEQLEWQRKKRIEAVMLRDERREMVREKIVRAESIQQKDDALVERAQAWAARKSYQYELKKDIEKQWFNEALAKREQIGLVQAQLSNDLESKLEEKVQKAILVKEQQAQLEEQKKLEKKLFRREELKLYYTDFIEKEEDRKKALQKEEKELLEHYMKVKEEAEREKAEKKKQLLATGKTLQEHHRTQVVRIIDRKNYILTFFRQDRITKETSKQKQDRLEYDKLKSESMTKEDLDLKTYMKSVSDAPWASENLLLKRYIHETVNKPKTIRYSKEPPNTKERLGFLPGKYKRPELVSWYFAGIH